MGNNFNGLTEAEAERLALLAEECGEVVMAIGKILRHGYESVNPLSRATQPRTNREALTLEAGDLLAAIDLLLMARDLEGQEVGAARDDKLQRVARWLHHQPTPPACDREGR